MKENNNELMSKATKSLMLKEAYYGLFLMLLNKEWTDKVSTAGVGKNGINYHLYVNEEFWESLTDLWRMMALKHNVLSIVFHHIEIGSDLPDREIASLASNLACNEFIDPSWLPLFDVKYRDYRDLNAELYEMIRKDVASKKMTREQAVEEFRKVPPRGVYRQDFHELNLKEKESMKYYYDELMKAKDKQPGKGGSAALQELLQDAKDEIPDGWQRDYKDFEGLSEAEKKLLRSQTDYMIKEVAEQIQKSRGTIPGELAGYIDNLNKKDPPKFNWKGYLRRFTGGSEKVDVLKTRMKHNIRFPESPGRRIRPRAHIFIGVDTSGSVSNEELREFFHEVYHMQKMGNDITIVQFDAGISDIQKYRKGIEDRIAIKGRGGTDFSPPCAYLNEHRREFSCAVFFTDGEAPPPDTNPTVPTLWVHSSRSSINQGLPGFKIQIPK